MTSEKLLKTNKKLEKKHGKASRYLISGLTLAPGNISGHEVCNWRGACLGACVLHFSGRRVMPVVRARAKRITRWFFNDREAFESQLRADIAAHIVRSKKLGLKCAVRLNVASDLDWLKIVREFPNVVFYDYTKSSSRMIDYIAGRFPKNYHLTFSDSERTNDKFLRRVLENSGNVARVFDVTYHPQSGTFGELPKTICVDGLWARVIDGDLHDVRIPSVDGRGVVIGLRLKGTNQAKKHARKRGFMK
jgi:hypothetical protein